MKNAPIKIAERRLELGETEVIVELFAPVKFQEQYPSYKCAWSITGMEATSPTEVTGDDGFEAIGRALTSILATLDPVRPNLSWKRGKRGIIGFDGSIPDGLGLEAYERLNAVLSKEFAEISKQRVVKVRRKPPKMSEDS